MSYKTSTIYPMEPLNTPNKKFDESRKDFKFFKSMSNNFSQ